MSQQATDPPEPMDSIHESTNGVADAPKKPYLRPALQSYGSLVDVTHFGGSQMIDSGGNLQNP